MPQRRVDRLVFGCFVVFVSILIVRNIVRQRQEHDLERAVTHGNAATALTLLDEGVCSGRTQPLNALLILATNTNQADVACALLQKGADPNCGNPNGQTMPLLNAAAHAPAAVPCLLAHGARIDAQNARGTTALMLAVIADHLATARLLLERGADVNLLDHIGATALYRATQKGDPALIDLLLAHGASLDIGDYGRGTPNLPLNQAIESGRLDLVRTLLLASEAHAGAPTAGTLNKALSQAVAARRPDMVRLLLQHGAQPDPQSNMWWLGVQTARRHGDTQTLRLLNRFGVSTRPTHAEVDARNVFAQTALMLETARGNIARARQLLAEGADVNASDRIKRTPLMIAVEHCHALVPELLARGANPNVITSGGMTPLCRAVLLGDLTLTRLLVAHGADANLRLPRGHTALYLARKHAHADIAALLTRAGGRVE